MIRTLPTIFALILIAAAPLSAATWLVNPDGTGDYAVIQDAVDAAAVSGDIVELADGIFTGSGTATSFATMAFRASPVSASRAATAL